MLNGMSLRKSFLKYLRGHKLELIKGSVLGAVGFILSPLSWWNDFFVNIPLAYVFAIFVTFILQPLFQFSVSGFVIFLGIGYWLTNLLGFWLLHRAVKTITEKTPHILWDLGISIAYTLIVILLAWLGFSQPIAQHLHLIPSWIIR